MDLESDTRNQWDIYIFQAEVNAIGKCAQVNIDWNYRIAGFQSYPTAMVPALSCYTINSKIISECPGTLNKLEKNSKITL